MNAGFLIGAFIAKVASIAGVGGLIGGLFCRKLPLAIFVGVAAGVVDTVVLASVRPGPVHPFSFFTAVAAGVLLALLGYVIYGRRRGRTKKAGGPEGSA